jgi:acetyl-CoA acetyltransferase
MREVFICDAVRTPVGRYGGSLSPIRADDLGAIPIKSLIDRNPGVNWLDVDDVIMGCANQAGEDNRNVARMSLLLAGLSETIPGMTINRLCGSGMDAIGNAARMIRSGEAELLLPAVWRACRAPRLSWTNLPRPSPAVSASTTAPSDGGSSIPKWRNCTAQRRSS